MDRPENLLPRRADQMVILLAEDEPIVRNIVRIVLESEGYFLLVAADGEEGLILSHSFPGEIDLLLSDIRMPNLDGLALSEQLLNERPTIKVILMSGDFVAPAGAMFLQKPFVPHVLKDAVRRALAPRSLRASA